MLSRPPGGAGFQTLRVYHPVMTLEEMPEIQQLTKEEKLQLVEDFKKRLADRL
jgi:hypothetical protein